jgi:hypothetical protein
MRRSAHELDRRAVLKVVNVRLAPKYSVFRPLTLDRDCSTAFEVRFVVESASISAKTFAQLVFRPCRKDSTFAYKPRFSIAPTLRRALYPSRKTMIVTRRFALVALALSPLFASPVFAQSEKSWDGVWTGVQGKQHAAPIQLAITDGKVVSYTLQGSPFSVQYSSITPTSISFGDRDHYFVKLKRTGDTTAMGKIHGRIGTGALTLTRQ